MSEERSRRVNVDFSSLTGMLWFTGYLFTIAFTGLPFWKGVLALVIWPYYLGFALR